MQHFSIYFPFQNQVVLQWNNGKNTEFYGKDQNSGMCTQIFQATNSFG